MDCVYVMKTVELVIVCLLSLVFDLPPTAVAIFDSTLSTAFLFSERFFSLFFIASGSWLQAWMISPTSSSYFLQLPKVLLHWFMAWTVDELFAAKSHSLMTEVTSSTSEDQQEQASAPLRLSQVAVWFLMCSMFSLQVSTSVVLKAGRLSG